MLCSNQTNGAMVEASTSTDNQSKSELKVDEDKEQTIPTAIAIIEPRKKVEVEVSGATSSSTTNTITTNTARIRPPPPPWSRLPQDIDVNNDIVRLVSSLSNVIQILIRMSNTAAHELLVHPEREEDFEGLRLLLNYADQMYSTLLQPQPNSGQQTAGTSSNRSDGIPSSSLFHHLFEPMLNPLEIREDITVTLPASMIAQLVEIPELESEDLTNDSTNNDSSETESHSVP